MYSTIQELIEEEFRHVTINTNLLHKLEKYIKDWSYKANNSENSEFLGSNLLGVHKFNFSKYDNVNFFKNILYASENKIQEAFNNLEGINTSYKVSSNGLYLSIVVLMYLTYISNQSNKTKERIIKSLFLIFSYKCFGSMYNHFFKYQADESTAKAAYENLNNKYIIKREGNWGGVFDHRAKDVLPGGIFEDRIKNITTENAVDVVTGIHTRFKHILKNLYVIYLETKEREEKVRSEGMFSKTGSNDEETLEIKETTTLHVKYTSYVKTIINIPNDLIDDDLVYLISSILPSCKKNKLESVLVGLSSIDYPKEPENDYIEKIIVSTLGYLTKKGIINNYSKNIRVCLKYLKGYWSAGTIKEPMAKEAKAMSNTLVQGLLDTSNKTVVPAVAIGFMLYIFIKAIKHYQD